MVDEERDFTFKDFCSWLRQRYFTREKLRRRFPPLTWMPTYSLSDLKGDLIAGISVAFTIVPQGLALAVLAGLPAQYGLYTSFMGCFIYALLGSCKDMAVGPTSIMAIITAPFVAEGGAQYAVLLAFLVGCVQLLFGVLNLGFIIDFISFPVISSFSSAAAITIAASQLKGFFGMHYSAIRLPATLAGFFRHLEQVHAWDTMLGFFCLLFLIPIQLAKDFRFQKNSYKQNLLRWKLLNFLWSLIVIGRNAIVVMICGYVLVMTYNPDSGYLFTPTKEFQPGLPSFNPPPFEIHSNTTNKNFGEVAGDLMPGVFVIALLGLMESVAVAKAFMVNKLDATQEMLALGICNIAGSFFGAFPGTGSFSRSAVNHNSGVATPFGGIITGTLVVAALSTLSEYFQYIPQTALSTIIIAAVIFMVHPSDARIIWETNKIDIIPYVLTFITCLGFGLEYGIFVGVSTSLVILLYQMARPKVYIVKRSTPEDLPYLYVKPDRSVFFPSVEYMKVKINKELPDLEPLDKLVIVIDGEHMFRADSTFALVRYMHIVCGVKCMRVKEPINIAINRNLLQKLLDKS